jgi:hypothetical protein
MAAGVKALTAVAGVRISRRAARMAAGVKALTAVADPTPAGAAIMIELAGCAIPVILWVETAAN